MKTGRRSFFKLAGVAGAGMITVERLPVMTRGASYRQPEGAEETTLMTELFLDNT